MNRKLIYVTLLCLVFGASSTIARTGTDTTVVSKDDPIAVKLTLNLSNDQGYIWPKDPKVMENLKKWQGCKFGLSIQMGLYSEFGIVESWAFSGRLDYPRWIRRLL